MTPKHSQAEMEAVARESWARHKPEMVATIKEIRATLDIGLYEAKGLCDIARGIEPSKVEPSTYDTHGSLGSISKAIEYVKSLDEWDSVKAEKWLRKYAAHLAREAKYIRENANGFAHDEEEFRCGLANGLGIDDEKEQDEIIAKIHQQKGAASG